MEVETELARPGESQGYLQMPHQYLFYIYKMAPRLKGGSKVGDHERRWGHLKGFALALQTFKEV